MDERPGPAGAVPAADSPRPVTAAGGAVKERGQAQDGQADELELRDALKAEGFTGDAFGALADYGYEFIKPLLSTGYIFTRCEKEGMKLLSLPIPVTAQGELAQETVSGALRVFKDYALDGDGWKPEGGASLKTYFPPYRERIPPPAVPPEPWARQWTIWAAPCTTSCSGLLLLLSKCSEDRHL